MKKSICIFLFLFGLISCGYAQNPDWKATASTSDSADMSPDNAIDGDMSTRWSSQFKDDQWLSIDMGKSQVINTITLVWEAAYTKSYSIMLSKDGKSWRKAYSTENGAGNTETIKLSKEEARYLKINLLKRGTEWGNSLFEVMVNQTGTGTPVGKGSASSGDEDYSADKALDKNMRTRWSSKFEDNQWWQVDFDSPRLICGVVLHWETAFGEIYNIEVQDMNDKWKKVYETAEGDGNRDIIYFAPVKAKRLKLNGIQRGTGWGFSLWEADFLNGSNPPLITAASSRKENPPELIMDGNRSTFWHSEKQAQSEIIIALPKVWELGGLALTWAGDYAKKYSISFSENNQDWKQVININDGNGKVDMDYIQPTRAKYIKINCLESATGNGFGLADVELKGGEEKATPIKLIQAVAKDEREGLYPYWLRRQQEFWTVTGIVGDNEESLISEMGSFEPTKGGFTVMPIVVDGSAVTTYADCTINQTLVDHYLPLPGVVWDHKDWNLIVTALSFGTPGAAYSMVRYSFKNLKKSAFNGKVILTVLPVQVNPVWQGGGQSAINTIEMATENGLSSVKINGEDKLYSSSKPKKVFAAGFSEGSVISYIKKGEYPDAMTANDSQGLGSGALTYELDIPPDGSKNDIVLLFPLYKNLPVPEGYKKSPGIFFEQKYQESLKDWKSRLDLFDIQVPEKRLIDVMKTYIAYILINKDGPWTKPGSRNYNHSWVRDGAMTVVSLLRMGLVKDVREWLDAVTPNVADTGMVPYIFFEGGKPVGFNYNDFSGEGKEFDSQGEYIYAARQYFDYTHDKDYLNATYPKVLSAAKFIHELRSQRLTDEYKNNPEKQAYYGILPPSNSHEGYYPAMSSYWDDYWALLGLKDAMYLAKQMNRNEDAVWLEAELKDFRSCVIQSIKKVIETRKIDNIPGCVEKADFDPTSTSIAIMACGELESLPQPYVTDMYNKYFTEFTNGMVPGHERTFTPYEDRTAEAFIRMDQRDRALTMLRYFVKDSVRPFGWNHMAEVVYAKYRTPSYIGDMPHTWVGSGYITAVRSIFAYEQDDQLFMGAGIPIEWFEKGMSVKNLPTLYGKLSYSIKTENNVIQFDISGNLKPPAGFVIPLPEQFKDYKVTVNDKNAVLKNGKLFLTELPAKIKLSK
jgi:hypothetical protein